MCSAGKDRRVLSASSGSELRTAVQLGKTGSSRVPPGWGPSDARTVRLEQQLRQRGPAQTTSTHEAMFSEGGAGHAVEKSLLAAENATAAQLAATQELVHAYHRQIEELSSKLEQVCSCLPGLACSMSC